MTASSVHGWYRTLARPPGTPPDWLFAPVWTVLYASIGVSAWLVWRRIEIAAFRKRLALQVWGWQLLANALWPAAFFGLRNPALGLATMAVLLVAVGFTVRAFWPLQRGAALLLLPYNTWLIFAAYLNFGFWWLNRV